MRIIYTLLNYVIYLQELKTEQGVLMEMEISFSHVMSTGAIISLAGILMMLTVTMLLMQQRNREHRTALFADLLK